MSSLVPDRLRLVPRRPGAFTERSFLEELCPTAWAHGWEEFFWGGEPFAFHLRSVGRAASSESEVSLARKLLKEFGLP